MDGLRFQLHKQFTEFTKRHPDFLTSGGTISLFAHSLGSVMAFDLLHETCQAQGVKHEEPPESLQGAQPVPSKAVEVKSPWQGGGVAFTATARSPESTIQLGAHSSPAGRDEPGRVQGERQARITHLLG